MTLNIAIAGAGGRMGRMLIQAVSDNPACSVSGALEHEASPLVGQDGARSRKAPWLLVGGEARALCVGLPGTPRTPSGNNQSL